MTHKKSKATGLPIEAPWIIDLVGYDPKQWTRWLEEPTEKLKP
jgi:hypothetical protein